MTVEDVMTTPAAACRAETNLAEASALMWVNDCGALPIMNDTGNVIGIVTDRDICIALGTRNIRPSDISVRDVSQDHLLVCRSSDDIHTALLRMREGKIRRLPVIDDDSRLAGIISMDDVVLNAQMDGSMGATISYPDVIGTLQAIYSRDTLARGECAA